MPGLLQGCFLAPFLIVAIVISLPISLGLCNISCWVWSCLIVPGLLQGYFLASFLFMAIVFSLPICLGLSALALDLPVGALLLIHLQPQRKRSLCSWLVTAWQA